MTQKLSNRFRLFRWKIKNFLNLKFRDKTILNFELINQWDFTKIDLETLEKDFRFTPPWGNMVNENEISKFTKENIKLTSQGIHFITTKVNDPITPFRVAGIITKKETDLPPFCRIEAEVIIPQYKGQWPALWTIDPVGTMPEFDLFEYFWPPRKPKAQFEGNLHWGTSYNSKKYKYQFPTKYPLSLLNKPIKIVGEFYPNESIFYLNNFPFWKSKQGYSPNKKVMLLNGNVHFSGGPEGNGPWTSMIVKNLKFYKLIDFVK